jgi:hypothetical protein
MNKPVIYDYLLLLPAGGREAIWMAADGDDVNLEIWTASQQRRRGCGRLAAAVFDCREGDNTRIRGR